MPRNRQLESGKERSPSVERFLVFRDPFERSCVTPRSPSTKRKLTSPGTEQSEKKNTRTEEKDMDAEYKEKIDRILIMLLDNKKENETLNKKMDDLQSMLKEEKTVRIKEMGQLKKQVEELKMEVQVCRKEIKEIQNKERKLNFVIKGIQEEKEESDDETVSKVKTFLQNKLGVQMEGVNKAYRMGRYSQQRKYHRIIMVKCQNENFKKNVLQMKGKLKGSQIYIEEDYSKEVREVRRKLFEKAVLERKEGKIAYVKFNKLIIDGETYGWNVERNGVEKTKIIQQSKN